VRVAHLANCFLNFCSARVYQHITVHDTGHGTMGWWYHDMIAVLPPAVRIAHLMSLLIVLLRLIVSKSAPGTKRNEFCSVSFRASILPPPFTSASAP
jgi:hypothetical protein